MTVVFSKGARTATDSGQNTALAFATEQTQHQAHPNANIKGLR